MILPAKPFSLDNFAGLSPCAAAEVTGSLGQRVYLTIREAIVSLTLGPGQMLRKPEICAELNVSRSPVADAFARLAAERLVVVVPQAGSFVARLSMNDIREGAFVREAIELAAVEMLASRITDQQIGSLRACLDRQAKFVQARDTARFYQADAEMHAMLLDFTGYGSLCKVADTAWTHVNRARRLLLPVPGRSAAALAEHHRIVDALAARNERLARAAMKRHLGQVMRMLEPLAATRPDLFESPVPQTKAKPR